LPSAIYATGVLNPGLAFKLAAAFGLAVARDAGFGYRDKPARVESVRIDRAGAVEIRTPGAWLKQLVSPSG
jgi:hypothetical protein